MLNKNDLRDQTQEELEASVRETRKELFTLVNDRKKTKKLEKPHLFKEKKKDLARLLTIIREKELARSDK